VTDSTTQAVAMISTDPYRLRLAELTERAESGCALPDPRDVTGTVLIAPPQGEPDPVDATRELWPASTRFTAVVRPEGSGFVDRGSFVDEDLTALSFARDTSAIDPLAWTVANGALRAPGGTGRRFCLFGEDTWNHLAIQTAVRVDGARAGVGVALPGSGVPSRGMFAVIERQGGGLTLAIYRRASGVQFVKLDEAALPAEVGAAGAIPLAVTAYDDRLRATAGGTSLEVARDELREGRLCLLAEGATEFTSLKVVGLDMYAFPFTTSRFRSFEEHIGSFDGQLDLIAPNALGPGTTMSTTSALWSATQAEIQASMQPAEPPEHRQAVFARWLAELGLPLKDEVTRLELSRFVEGDGTQLFLIESPEPLDLTEEIDLRLERRERVGIRPEVVPSGERQVTELRRAGRGERARRVTETRRRFREETFAGRAPQEATSGAGTIFQDVTRQGDRLAVELDGRALAAAGVSLEQLILVEVASDGRLRFHRGRPARRPVHGRETIRARLAEDPTVRSEELSSRLAKELSVLPAGAVVALDETLSRLVDWWRPAYRYVEVDVAVLQDGSGRRVLIIPLAGGSVSPLASGVYPLTFNLDRARWQTTAAVDDLNHYRRTAVLGLTL